MPKYDIAVLGTGLAGLFSALKLSQAGKRVIVFDAATKPGGRAAHMHIAGNRCEAIPIPTYDFEPGGPLRQLCDEAGLSDLPLKESKEYQVALPHGRITIYRSLGDTLTELKREFPREADKAETIYRSLGARVEKAAKSRVSSYLLRRRTARDYLSSLRISTDFFTFFDVQSRVFLGRPLNELRLDTFALLVTKAPQVPDGGYGRLAEYLCERIVKQGGELRLEVSWPSMLHRSKKIIGLQTESETIDAGSVILNAVEREQDRRLLLHLPGSAIPVEMREVLCCLPEYGNMDDLFTLTFADRRRSGEREDSIVPIEAVFSGVSSVKMSRTSLLELIAAVIPFLHELIRSEGEDDPSARVYPCETIPLPFRKDLEGTTRRFKSAGFKNLYLVPDGNGPTASLAELRRLIRRLS